MIIPIEAYFSGLETVADEIYEIGNLNIKKDAKLRKDAAHEHSPRFDALLDHLETKYIDRNVSLLTDDLDFMKRQIAINFIRGQNGNDVIRTSFKENIPLEDLMADDLERYSVDNDLTSVDLKEWNSVLINPFYNLNGQKRSDFRREGSRFVPTDFNVKGNSISKKATVLAGSAFVSSGIYADLSDFAPDEFHYIVPILALSTFGSGLAWDHFSSKLKGVDDFNELTSRAKDLNEKVQEYDITKKDIYL